MQVYSVHKKGFRFHTVVPEPASDADEDTPNAAPKSRVKYTCEICDLNAWAKADAQLSCTICAIPLSPNFPPTQYK